MSTSENDDIYNESLLAQAEDSDEDEIDWEEVDVVTPSALQGLETNATYNSSDLHLDLEPGPSSSTRQDIEITLLKQPNKKDPAK